MPVGARAALIPAGAGLAAPADIRADAWATVPNPAAFAVDARNRLWVTSSPRGPQLDGRVYVVPRQGRPPVLVLSGLQRPLGLVWHRDELYVSSTGRVDAYGGLTGFRFTRRRNVIRDLPSGSHQNDAVAVGPDGRLYLGIGSMCNACPPTHPYEAAIISFLPSGKGVRVVARGLRNPYGLAFIPGRGVLLATENGRDDLGRDAPPDELNVIVPGRRYGYPDCWHQGGPACIGVSSPLVGLPPHASADGIAVINRTWGARYGTSAFIAQFGSSSLPRTGHDLVRVALTRLPDGRWRGRTSVFATGFTNPLAVVAAPQGLLVGDWTTGTIYRLRRSDRRAEVPAASPATARDPRRS
jgi:glucose/arabinose dehydrogenase